MVVKKINNTSSSQSSKSVRKFGVCHGAAFALPRNFDPVFVCPASFRWISPGAVPHFRFTNVRYIGRFRRGVILPKRAIRVPSSSCMPVFLGTSWTIFSGGVSTGGISTGCLRLLRSMHTARPAITRPKTPPTTAPAIAPAWEFFGLGHGVREAEAGHGVEGVETVDGRFAKRG